MVRITDSIDFKKINDIIDLTLADYRRPQIAKRVECAKSSVYYTQNDLDLL